jgi:hypothetical protein
MQPTLWKRWAFALGVGVVACSSEAKGPLSSHGAVRTALGTYVVAPEEGVISDGARELRLDGEPTKITLVGDRLYVSLRAARAVAILEETDVGLIERGRLAVGVEPVGIVGSPDGERLYVAASISGRVEEYDLASHTLARSFAVAGEPRWLAVHPSGATLYVATARGGLQAIDLADGATRLIEAPEMLGLAGTALPQRYTGDPAISRAGDRLFAPAIAVDPGVPIEVTTPYYSSGRIAPEIITVALDDTGRPVTPRATWINYRAQLRITPPTGAVSMPVSYPSAIAVAPDDEVLAIAFEGSDAVAIAEVPPARLYADATVGIVANAIFLPNPIGAKALVFEGEDTLATYSAVTRRLTRHQLPDVAEGLRTFDPDWALLRETIETEAPIEVVEQRLDDRLERGRRLFYTAVDSRVSLPFSGMSCATCHFEGRDDGITWNPPGVGARQTPSLAAGISKRAPFRWNGDRATVAEDAARTIGDLMSGTGLPDEDADALAAYLDTIRPVDRSDVASDAIERGRRIFDSVEVGCAGCHSGETHSDAKIYALFDLPAVKTRSLVGIAATAPYLHDGSAPTMRALLERSRDGSMGNTRMLGETELADLEAYVLSL